MKDDWAVVAILAYKPYLARVVYRRSVSTRRAVARGAGYGESGGSETTKRRRASAGPHIAFAFSLEADASVVRRRRAAGSGSTCEGDSADPGNGGVNKKVCATFPNKFGVITMTFAA